MPNRIVIVNDRMQQGYRYALSARPGRDFAPEFTPDLTPAEMLELGVFCGGASKKLDVQVGHAGTAQRSSIRQGCWRLELLYLEPRVTRED